MSIEDELPDGLELANSLSDYFQDGGKLEGESSVQDKIDSNSWKNWHDRPNLPQPFISLFVEQYVEGLSDNGIIRLDRRSAAFYIRASFDEWRPKIITNLENDKRRSRWNDVIRSLQDLTLQDIADYARQQFRYYSREAARAVSNTSEYNEVRLKSDYWSRMEEIISPTVHPDE